MRRMRIVICWWDDAKGLAVSCVGNWEDLKKKKKGVRRLQGE